MVALTLDRKIVLIKGIKIYPHGLWERHPVGMEENTMSLAHSPAAARTISRLNAAASPALETALDAARAGYDRRRALSRFHRLSPQIIETRTPEAAGAVLREIERALRVERARRGHWTYDLNRHIALLVAYRAESARLTEIRKTCA